MSAEFEDYGPPSPRIMDHGSAAYVGNSYINEVCVPR